MKWKNYLKNAYLLIVLFGILFFSLWLIFPSFIQRNRPSNIFWLWERKTEISSVPQDVGFAILVAEIHVIKGKMLVHYRQQPAILPPDVWKEAVIRLEISPLEMDNIPTDNLAQEVIGLSRVTEMSGLQIDFDATVSQRKWYRSFINKIRKELPKKKPLAITALASWCLGDKWMKGLPVDLVIPQLFRMGPEGNIIINSLVKTRQFPNPIYLKAVGWSIDECYIPQFNASTMYWFSPEAWTESKIKEVIEIKNERNKKNVLVFNHRYASDIRDSFSQ